MAAPEVSTEFWLVLLLKLEQRTVALCAAPGGDPTPDWEQCTVDRQARTGDWARICLCKRTRIHYT